MFSQDDFPGGLGRDRACVPRPRARPPVVWRRCNTCRLGRPVAQRVVRQVRRVVVARSHRAGPLSRPRPSARLHARRTSPIEPTAEPTVGNLFGSERYDGGESSHALRQEIGDDPSSRCCSDGCRERRDVTRTDRLHGARRRGGRSQRQHLDDPWPYAPSSRPSSHVTQRVGRHGQRDPTGWRPNQQARSTIDLTWPRRRRGGLWRPCGQVDPSHRRAGPPSEAAGDRRRAGGWYRGPAISRPCPPARFSGDAVADVPPADGDPRRPVEADRVPPVTGTPSGPPQGTGTSRRPGRGRARDGGDETT